MPHDPAWRETFEAEAATLRSVLGDEAVAVHHIGSTSIRGLAAKPIIDVLVEVQQIEKVDSLNEPMAEKAYEAWGEHGIPCRRFFTKNLGPERRYNVHIFQAGTAEVERHLVFRDYLIQNPETARAYGDLKKNLAEKFPADIESYMDGKNTFIKQTESEALSWNRTSHEVS